jgi:hypothetical protein
MEEAVMTAAHVLSAAAVLVSLLVIVLAVLVHTGRITLCEENGRLDWGRTLRSIRWRRT